MNLIVSDEELDLILTHPSNVTHKVMHEGKGRPLGRETIPLEQRAMIGIFAQLEGPSLASEVLGVSKAQASNLSHGSTVNGRGNPELKELMKSKVEDIHELAAEKLLETLGAIDMGKVGEEKPLTQSTIAKNFAGIIEKTSPKVGAQTNVQVVVYKPQPVDNSQFEAVEVEAIVK